jgi:hypothetical protein
VVAPTKRLDVNGITTGELITTGNTNLSQVVSALTGSGTAEPTSALRGAKGVHVTGVLNDTYSLLYTDTAAASASAQIYFRLQAVPTASLVFFSIRNATADMGRAAIITGTGVLQLQNLAGSNVAWAEGAFTPTLDTKYRVQIQVTKGTGTGDGTFKAQLYDDSDTLLRSLNVTNQNTGTTDATTIRCGKVATGSDGVDIDLDELAYAMGTTAEIDPAPLNTAPLAGLDQVVDPFALVTLIGLDAETDPAWSQTGGTPTVTFLEGSGATRTFIAPATRAGTTLTFTLDDGQGLTDTMNVIVYPHNEWALIDNVEVPMQLLKA